METKRQENLKGLKVKYLGATNTLGARIKFIETNSGNQKTIQRDYRYDVLETAYNILDKNNNVISYNLIIDNTQNDYYLISVNVKNFDESIIDKI